jgi:hypothetical protein
MADVHAVEVADGNQRAPGQGSERSGAIDAARQHAARLYYTRRRRANPTDWRVVATPEVRARPGKPLAAWTNPRL